MKFGPSPEKLAPSQLKTALLIDDDADFRSLLTELLRAHGWDVVQAGDGDSGLQMALERKPDVVLCDLLMPRCNGFQFCRALHAERGRLPDTRIVVTAGSSYSIDRINAFESGADAYLTKPVKLNELLDVLARLTSLKFKTPASDVSTLDDGHATTLVRFWGVRGSIPVPGPDTVYYGGNTSCVEVRGDGQLIVLDAGTGLRGLGHHLKREFGDRSIELSILISHTHWDHIQGFPFFSPAYDPKNQIRVIALDGPRKSLEATLAIQMESPYFPITMQEMPGNIRFEALKSLEFDLGPVHVKAAFMNHPGICAGYRLFTSAGSVVYFPDNELFGRQLVPGEESSAEVREFAAARDEQLETFIRGADVVISDAQYSAEEYAAHVGWGHSCADDVVRLALRAGVKQLFLFHHDPDHTDAEIAQMLAKARRLAAPSGASLLVEAAREGLEVRLAPKPA